MAFIINNEVVPFDAYGTLKKHEAEFPVVLEIIAFLDRWFDSKIDEIQVFTSGSTGNPKPIYLAKSAMIKSAQKTEKFFGYQEGSSALLCLPVNFIAGKMMLVRSLVSKLDLVITEPTGNPLLQINRKIDFLPMTPFQLQLVWKKSAEKLDLIKTILLGGATVSTSLLKTIQEIKTQVYHGFGMTETITHIAVRNLTAQEQEYNSVDGVSFSVDDHSCLRIKADHLEESIQTNDLVLLNSSNSFTWLGRKDNVINTGGIKLNPETLELKIDSLINQRYIFSAIPDSLLGQKLILLIETTDLVDKESLKKNLSSLLTKYESPKTIYLLDRFIYTPSGKIDRNKTIDLLADAN